MKITVHTNKPLRTLRSGIGASWHAISSGPQNTSAGSAWGGNPPAADEQRWQEIYHHADWLGLNFIRAEIEQRSYQPQRNNFTWQSEDMLALRRILDWCQSRNADVMLQQMWANVDWNTYPGVDALHSAPLDLDVYVDGIAILAEKLTREWGYSCIKYICINNEPERDFSWWQGYGHQPLKIAPGLKAARLALDKRNIHIPLIGPDYTGLVHPGTSAAECEPYLGAFDLHTYLDDFKLTPVGQNDSEKNLKAWIDFANSKGKPFLLTEFGSMNFGWYANHPAPGGYAANLKNSETILRALRLGVEGFNRWSFNNRGDLDGQWQLLDTWDTSADQLLPTFQPHPNAYWLFGLVTRFFKKCSTLLDTHVDAVIKGWQQYLLAETLLSPDGHLNIFVLSHTEQCQAIELTLLDLAETKTLHRYRITDAIRNKSQGVSLEPDTSFSLSPNAPTLNDIAPGLSLTVYSTRHLPHSANALPL